MSEQLKQPNHQQESISAQDVDVLDELNTQIDAHYDPEQDFELPVVEIDGQAFRMEDAMNLTAKAGIYNEATGTWDPRPEDMQGPRVILRSEDGDEQIEMSADEYAEATVEDTGGSVEQESTTAITGDEAVGWLEDHGLKDGRFFVGRSSGETDYGGWNIQSVHTNAEGQPVRLVIKKADEDAYKSVDPITLLKNQTTPSGTTNISALRAAWKLEGIEDPIASQASSQEAESTQEKLKESRLAEDLLQWEHAYGPVDSVEMNGRSFGVSRPIEGGRNYAVIWSDHDGQVVPRLAYKSQSAGDWRIAYRVESDGRIAKESRREGRFHYTQENKLHDEIAAKLDELQEQQPFEDDENRTYTNYLRQAFLDIDRSDMANEIDSAAEELIFDESADRLLSALTQDITAGELGTERGKRLKDKFGSISTYFKSLDKEFKRIPGFVPDFAGEPAYRKVQQHPLLGEYTVEAFEAQLDGKSVTWTMGQDKEGRTWIDGIRYTDVEPSSYGTGSVIIDSGILTSKPVEYKSQATSLVSGKESMPLDGTDSYVDISPALSNLLPVRKYKKAQKKRK